MKKLLIYTILPLICDSSALQADNKTTNDPSNDFSWIQFWGPDIVPHPHLPDPNAPPPGPRIAEFYRYKAECAIAKEWKEFLDRYPEQERYEMLQEIIKYIVNIEE